MKLGIVALPLCAAIALSTAAIRPVNADRLERVVIDGTKPALAIGLAACLTSSSDLGAGLNRATKAADSVLTSVVAARVIKNWVGFKTGTSQSHRFPSGHAAAAFAMARQLEKISPKNKWVYYAGAALVGYSTVRLRTHSWADVAAGAAIGVAVSNISISANNGLLVSHVIRF